MPTLSPERLAALVDELPTAEEQALLASSPALRAELEAYRRLRTIATAERDRVGPPLTTWAALSAQLSAAGVTAPPAGGATQAPRGATVTPIRSARTWLVRAATILVLLGTGAVAGRVSAGAAVWPTGGPAGEPMSPGELTASPVANTAPAFASTQEAAAALEQAERTYRLAAAFLAEHDSTDGTGDVEQVRTRLAALEQMVATSRAALYAAPQDPVINQYYLATLGAREATLQQLNGAQPVAVRVAY